jgi:hypothetical protein
MSRDDKQGAPQGVPLAGTRVDEEAVLRKPNRRTPRKPFLKSWPRRVKRQIDHEQIDHETVRKSMP